MAAHIVGPLHRVTVGETGPSMVFLHPNPLDWSCWLYQMTHFSSRYRTIAVDLPGYGWSPAALDGLTMTDVADACWEAIDELSGEPAVLVGCSLGSWVAMHMAHQRPDAVSAVVLSGVGYSPGKEFAPKRISGYEEHGIAYRRTHAYEVVSESFGTSARGRYLIESILERDNTVDIFTVIEMFRALGEPDPAWFWTALKPPCLIITGELDNAHQRALALADHIPGVEIVTLADAGHTCCMEQPWDFDDALADFLRRLDP